jgi:hypothetical protein
MGFEENLDGAVGGCGEVEREVERFGAVGGSEIQEESFLVIKFGIF